MTATSNTDSYDDSKINIAGIVFISLVTTSLPALFIYQFSGIGIGLETASHTVDTSDDAEIPLAILGCMILVMYLLDVNVWSPQGILSTVFSTTLAIVAVVTLLLMTGKNPYWPICIFSVVVPLFLIAIKHLLFRSISAIVYVQTISVILVILGYIVGILFILWISLPIIDPTGMGNEWDSETRANYADRAGCATNFDELPYCSNQGMPCFFNSNDDLVHFSKACPMDCLDIYEECSISFIIWINPGLAALSLVFMGRVVKYLHPNNLMNEEVLSVIKSTGIILFLFWIYASLAGAGSGLTGSLISFSISMFVGTGIIVASLAWGKLLNSDGDQIAGDVMEKNKAYLDLVKGFVILALSPILVAYLVLSALNQMVRKMKSCVTGIPLDYNGILTKKGAEQVEDFINWDHSKVLTYAVYWGFGYVFVNVLASKFTTVFLSWLIETTSEMNIPSVTGIVVLVGLCLFMLPPIPGLPIYLTSGIVLVSVGMETLGLINAIIYATVVSLGIKLLACVIQQKVIGEMLGGSIAVKQMVSVNSDGVRAMRLILSDKGVTSRKVAVLCGGPDWPVSVLCGILGLDLFPILYGTLPVLLPLVPTVLTGSFAFMGSMESDDGLDKYPWADTMGAVSSALAAAAMFYFSIAAAAAISSTIENDKEAMAALEYDNDVKVADAETAKLNAIKDRVRVWSNVPFVFKFFLILSVLSMMTCCYILVLFNEQSFEDYDLMYTIDEHLGGNWTNIVKPLGRIALLLFLVSYGLLFLFDSWVNRETQKSIDTSNEGEIEPLTSNSAYTAKLY